MGVDLTFPLRWLWNPISKKIEEWFNPLLIRVDDFRDAQSLAKKLQKSKDPLSRYIRGQLNHEDRLKLETYVAKPALNRSFPKYLSDILNQQLKGPSLYSEAGLDREALSEDTNNLLDQRPTGKELVRLNRLSLEDTYPREIARSYLPFRVKLALTLLPILAFGGIFCWTQKVIEYVALQNRDTTRYGFEDQSKAPGWVVSDDPESGVALKPNPGVSVDYKVKGNASMAIHVELDGTPEGRSMNRDEGEVFVDPTMNRPLGYPDPLQSLDLSNKTLSASIIIPANKLVGKERGKPIYAQMFLVSCDAPNQRFDLPVKNITSAGQLDLQYRTSDVMNAICKIGIKIGLNSEDGNIYQGDIYVDAVNW